MLSAAANICRSGALELTPQITQNNRSLITHLCRVGQEASEPYRMPLYVRAGSLDRES
jgi:hypothetical protein